MSHPILQLVEYHAWANDRLFALLDELPEAVFGAAVKSAFPSIAQAAAHMYIFDQLWLSVLMEKSNEEIFPMIDAWTREATGKNAGEMRRLFAAAADRYRALLARTPDPDKEMTVEHPQYGRLTTRFSDIVRHVVNHGTYHRGHISAMLRQLGHSGVPTDYVFYLFEKQG